MLTVCYYWSCSFWLKRIRKRGNLQSLKFVESLRQPITTLILPPIPFSTPLLTHNTESSTAPYRSTLWQCTRAKHWTFIHQWAQRRILTSNSSCVPWQRVDCGPKHFSHSQYTLDSETCQNCFSE
jgi:hypothetical protein